MYFIARIFFLYFLVGRLVFCVKEMESFNKSDCTDILYDINLPCLCSKDELNGTVIDCAEVTFPGTFPVLPYRYTIHSFSQTASGLQSLEAQLFTASDIPLQKIDFSYNMLRRITERAFDGVEDTLKEINLSNNKLGEQLNSIFSTSEFQKLAHLKFLDLSNNEIRDFQPGVFNGLVKLQELKLGCNLISAIPRSALQSLKDLKSIHLHVNNILDIGYHSFPNLTNLQFLNLSSNDVRSIQNGAFKSLSNLRTLVLSNNQIRSVGSGFLEGLNQLVHLDLSQNLLEVLPSLISSIPSLRTLILSGNKFRSLSDIPLDNFAYLESLDLQRNRIFKIPSYGFASLKNLKELHLDVNTIRKVTNEMFLGLGKLSDLTLSDNRLLAFPTGPLTVLNKLHKLNLDYNRIAVISQEILSPLNQSKELSLAYNLISEIPDGAFQEFKNLELLNFYGNKISIFNTKKTKGLEGTLLYLDIGYNEIVELPDLHFPNLLILSLSRNKIVKLNTDIFTSLEKLIHLNVSHNMLQNFTSNLFVNLLSIQYLDLQHNFLNQISSGVFKNLSVIEINLRNNILSEISEASFEDLVYLQNLDFSFNQINRIAAKALKNIPNIQTLNFMGNDLSVFKGNEISGKTSLKNLILSQNQITYLYPKTFILHPEIENLDLSSNKLTFFPHEIVSDLRYLMQVNLAGNKIHYIGDGVFSNMMKLKIIDLQNNVISSISEFSFQNSSNLRKIFLQNNQISSLNENIFIGLNRLKLDLSNNNLTSFPKNLFSRARGLRLEEINLAGNRLNDFPNEPLKKQYSFLEKLNISYNNIKNLPSNDDVLVNVKELDISNNPLLPDAHYVLFGEPKSVRKLFVQKIGLSNLPVVECPFLTNLNLQGNKLSKIAANVFERTNMLRSLDLSKNRVTDFERNFIPLWMKLPYLQSLDLCENSIQLISKRGFSLLLHLQHLSICNLKGLVEFNCESLDSLPRLKKLEMHGFPNLRQIPIKDCLQNITSLEFLGIEMKDTILKDQLQSLFSPKLTTLHLSGNNLRSVSSSAFAGILSPSIKIQIAETSIENFTDKIFLPLPLSSKIEFNIPFNKVQYPSSEMLAIIENKQIDISIYGLNSNPIKCDCHIHFFWKWLQDKTNLTFDVHPKYAQLKKLMCFEPSQLKNQVLKNVFLRDLVCEFESSVSKGTEMTLDIATVFNTILDEATLTYEQPIIIFEQPVTKKPVTYIPSSSTHNTLTKVDTMIIGIVAGVAAFVCILIIIICVVRLRRTHPLYTAGPLAGPLAFRAQGKCTCLKPPSNNCTCYPLYPLPFAGRPSLPQSAQDKMILSHLPPTDFTTTSRHSAMLRNTSYYVTYPDSDNDK